MKQGKATAIALMSLMVMLGGAWTAADDKTEVLATVGEEAITLQDFAERHAALVSWFGMGVKVGEVQSALEQMIFRRLLAREALQSGLASQATIQDRINEMLAQEYLRSLLPPEKLVVEEAESKSYYDQQREQFRRPLLVRLSHILVASEAEAQALRPAVQDPEAFGTLARQRSLDPASAQQGGDLGWVVAVQLAPRLAEAVLALEPGQLSEVIKTDFGYHLVKLTEKPPPRYQPYEEVQQQVEKEVVAAKQKTLRRDIQAALWTKYHVAIHREVLETVVQGSQGHGEGGAEAPPGVSLPQQHQRPAGQGPGPQLRLLSAVYNLGTIPAETITHTSLVMNSGDAELIIRKVQSPCRCVEASISPVHLLPGQTGQLTVVFNPNYSREEGRTTKTIYLESNDPEAPRKSMYLAAEIVRGQPANAQP